MKSGAVVAVLVAMPEGYKAGDGKKYPALIVTDGDFTFGYVHEAAGSLSGAITPLFIISVGTSLEEGEPEHTKRRIHEFFPPGWDRKDTFGELITQFCKPGMGHTDVMGTSVVRGLRTLYSK